MAIVSILMSAGTIIVYFFLSLFIPFLTYLIPYYKITRGKDHPYQTSLFELLPYTFYNAFQVGL